MDIDDNIHISITRNKGEFRLDLNYFSLSESCTLMCMLLNTMYILFNTNAFNINHNCFTLMCMLFNLMYILLNTNSIFAFKQYLSNVFIKIHVCTLKWQRSSIN